MKKKQNISVYVPFTKSDDVERMVYGYCTSESLDSQGEIILHDAIVKAWDAYMEYANIREMHQASAVGVTKEYSHDDKGTFIGVKVVDDNAWKKVSEGVYKGFSIGGRVTKKKGNIIEGIILSEISLVDRPANPDAKFAVSKVDDVLVDQLELEANEFSKMKFKFIEIEGVKYKEDPENEGQPLKDADGKDVLWTAEDQTAFDAQEDEDNEPVETDEEKKQREDKEQEDANIAAGLNADGSPKEDAGGKDDKGGEVAAAGGDSGAAADGEKEKAATSEFIKKAVESGALSKDSDGVIMLASLLDHLEFVGECLGDDVQKTLEPVKAALMSAIAAQTATKESAQGNGDLQKMLGSELSKALNPLLEKMGTLEQSVDSVKADVDAIKGTRVSPRPKGAAAVEKVIEKGTGSNDKEQVAKRAEIETISKEIDDFAKEWGPKVAADTTLTATFMSKSAELHTRFTAAKRELNDMLSFGSN